MCYEESQKSQKVNYFFNALNQALGKLITGSSGTLAIPNQRHLERSYVTSPWYL